METNSMIYRTDKVVGNKHIFVTIRLNDECKNGHQDFAITADIYEKDKPKIDKYWLSGGCCHEEILKAFPKFKMFVDLHLCDYLGNPMYATANGFYHLKNGFHSEPINSSNFENKFCEYYRISKKDFKVLSGAESKVHYAMLLMELDIPSKWKKKADKAIKTLESLTNSKFLVDSVRDQFGMPSEEELAEERKKIANGYYTAEQKKKRHNESVKLFIEELKESAKKKVEEIYKERDIKIELFKIGGKKLLDSAIYYSHTDTLSFNWRSYGKKVTQEEADKIMSSNKYLSKIKYEVK